MDLMILFAAFGLLPVLLAVKLDKGVEETAPFTVFSVILIMYISGFARNLNAGVIASLVFVSALAVWCIADMVKKGGVINRLEPVITPSFFVFGFMFLFFWFFSRNRMVCQSDEWSHWALIVKNMLEYNNFGNDVGTTTEFFDYPPAQAVLLYLFTKLSGAFSEARIYFAGGVFMASIYTMCVKKIELKKVYVWIPLAAAYISFFAFIRDRYPFTLYVDHKLAYMFAFLVLYWVLCKHDGFFFANFSLGLAVLTIIKSTGFALACFVVAIVIMYEACKKGEKHLWTALSIAPAFAINRSWSWYVNTYAVGGEYWNTSEITLESILAIFNGTAPEFQYTAIKNFAKAFVWIRATYMPYGIGVIVAFVALVVFAKLCNDGRMKKIFTVQAVLMPLFMLAFAATMLLLYLFSFGEQGAVNLASYDRYMSTMFVGVFLVILAEVCIFISDKKINLPAWFCPAVCIFAVAFQIFAQPQGYLFHPIASARESVEVMSEYTHIKGMEQYMEPGAKLCFLSDGSMDGRHERATAYTLTPYNPVKTVITGRMSELVPGSEEAAVESAGEWYDGVKEGGFAYLYLHADNPEFVQHYGKYFDDPSQIGARCLYSFDGEKFTLVADLNNL